MSTKVQKSSRAWCLSRLRSKKKDSEHRKNRKRLRKDAMNAISNNDEAAAKPILEAWNKAKALKNAFVKRMRRSASRGT